VALIKGSLPLAAMVARRTYQITYTGTDALSLNVVAKHSSALTDPA
jgi:RIO-like serine/threonine protein kinase